MRKQLSLFFCVISLSVITPVLAVDELVVSAAASLTEAFNEIKSEFEKENPNVRVVANYAASGALFRQIQQGAPVDVYASANIDWMEELINLKLVDSRDTAIFAHNDLVLAVSSANQLNISNLHDLKNPEVRRIGIGNPATVPAGQYAMRLLKNMGLWKDIEPKFIYGETVIQIVSYMRRNEVDAGFIFVSDLKRGGDEVFEIFRLSMQTRPTYPVAVLKQSRNQELAQKFVDLVLSETGQAIMEKHGFIRGR